MAKKKEAGIFKTYEEYKSFYALDKNVPSNKKSDYYKVGEELAKMVFQNNQATF